LGKQPVQGRDCAGCQRRNVSFRHYQKNTSLWHSTSKNNRPSWLTSWPRIDHSRVVRTFREIDHIPLVRSYLIQCCPTCKFMCVSLLVTQLNIPGSSTSKPSTMLTTISSSKKKTIRLFVTRLTASTNNISFAKRLERHELLEFRRLAAHLYKAGIFGT
jgi:hypothetical protein